MIEFIQDKLRTKEEVIIPDKQAYNNSKELIKKLEDIPIEEAEKIKAGSEQENISKPQTDEQTSNITNSSNYVTTYNTTSDSYEIYSEEELLNTTKQLAETENEKIEKNDLSGFYSAQISKVPEESGKTTIYITILAIIIVLAVLIRYNIHKNKRTK